MSKELTYECELKVRLRIEQEKLDKSGVYGYTQRTLAYKEVH